MQKTRKMLSLLLAVLMLLSMCTVGMVSASALPQDAVINDTEGADASGIDGEVLGLMGDSDANGTINVIDATQIQKFAAKLIELNETNQALADVNLDDKVNVKDATAIQKWVAKYDVEEPINCVVYIPTEATVPTTEATVPTIVTVPTTEATEDEPTTTATEDEPTPSIPVIVIPTTAVVEPTEAPTQVPTAEPTEAPTQAPTAEPTEAPATTTAAATTAAVTDAPAGPVTIYFQNNWMWGDVSFYAWGDDGAMAEWPGEAMTFVENDGNYDVYSMVVPEGVKGFLINGTKDTAPDTRDQTPDILEWTDGQCFYMVWDAEANEGAGGNSIGSFPYVAPTEPATTTATATTAADTTAADTTVADTTAADTTAADTTAADTTVADTTVADTTVADTTVVDDGMITVYFSNNKGWEKVYVYAFYGEVGGTTTGRPLGDYPGTEMTFVRNNQYGQAISSIEVPADIDYIKFSDGTEANNRTDNIANAELADGIGFYLLDKGEKYWPYETYEYDVPADTTAAPTTTVADTTVADTTVADTTVADTTVADTTVADTTVADTTVAETTVADTTVADDGTITIYFTNNKGWANAYIYGFYGVAGGTATGKPLGDYPGVAMTYVRDNQYGQKIYSAEVPADIDYIKFCDGNTADNHRTDNIPNAEFEDGIGFYLLDKGDAKYWPYETYEYDVPADTTAAPTTTVADTTVADTTVADTTVADTTVADTTVADTTAEETTVAPTTVAPTEPAGIKVYAINSAKWSTVYAYYWGGVTTPTWPGKAMTKTADTVNGFDVYEFTFETAPESIIFNNNNNGSQTADLTFQAGQYFDVKGGKWYKSLDDVPAVSASSTDRYLVGSFNGWSTTANEFMSADGKIARVEMDLAANTTYEFKIVREGTWTSCKETLSITNSATGLTFSSSVQGNTKLTTKNAGTYVFEFDLATSQLTVTYP